MSRDPHLRLEDISNHSDKRRAFANRLGSTPHLSALLVKAQRLGLKIPQDLERLAVQRGLRYYDPYGDSLKQSGEQTELSVVPSEDAFTNEELAVALLSPAAPYSMQRLRMSAAMVGADGNKPETIAQLAKWERSESIIRHIACCGRKAEPENPFWPRLLEMLPESPPHPDDILPDLSRFVAMTGLGRNGKGPFMKWIRPVADRKP